MGASTKLILFQILQTFDCHSREACPRADWGAGIQGCAYNERILRFSPDKKNSIFVSKIFSPNNVMNKQKQITTTN